MYGITLADFNRMVAERSGKCDCCGDVPKKQLLVDHDHTTGDIRGLLCPACNAGIGLLGDSPDGLRLAVAYLERAGGLRLHSPQVKEG